MSNILAPATVLFDMDGTLTYPRKVIDVSVTETVSSLLAYANVGIVTGSGFDYVKQQCSMLWETKGIDLRKLTLFPCNGTQVYQWINGAWTIVHNANMREELGDENTDKLFQGILQLQANYAEEYLGRSPLTGHFVSYRNSLLNWCPIGRNAGESERTAFSHIDEDGTIRRALRNQLTTWLNMHDVGGITIALGGSTSLDVYPTGWDKTYALSHFLNEKNIWFVGDRCRGTGNDRTIFERLIPTVRAFETTGPSITIEIINDKIIPRLKENSK